MEKTSYHGNGKTDRTEAARSSAGRLYRLAGGGQPRALFLLQMDALLLRTAQLPAEGHTAEDFNFRLRGLWKEAFPSLSFSAEVERAVNDYRRDARVWIWPVFLGKSQARPSDQEALCALLTVCRAVQSGVWERAALEQLPTPGVGQELAVYLGDGLFFPEAFGERLQSLGLTDALHGCLARWQQDGGRAAPARPEPAAPAAPRRREEPAGSGERPLWENALRTAQQNLTWMLLVSRQEEDWETAAAELEQRLLGRQEPAAQTRWRENFAALLNRQRELMALVRFPYRELRDTSVKTAARLRFSAVYAVACEPAAQVGLQELTCRAVEIARQSFAGSEQMAALEAPMRHLLERYYLRGDPQTLCPQAWEYLREHFEDVECCFEWLCEIDADAVNSSREEIERQRSEAAEDLLVRRHEIECQAVAELIKGLCDPMYGNILGRMYNAACSAQPGDAQKAQGLLQDFFAMLKQRGVRPVAGEEDLYPGWMVEELTAVSPVRREEN